MATNHTAHDSRMIQTHDLSLRLGDYLSIRDLNLSVERGEIFGLIGPLGSGKSSILKIVAGMLPFDAGRVLVDGLDVASQSDRVRARIGYMPGYQGAYDDLQTRGFLEFFARACGVDPAAIRSRIDDLLELAGLTAQADFFLSVLSIEDRHRLAVIKAAVHGPPVLLFDEPAVGLSTSARIRLRRLIGDLAARDNATVLICSNVLTDLNGLCGRLGVMHGGRLVTSGPADAVARRLAGARLLEIEFTGPVDPVKALFKAHPAVIDVGSHGDHLIVAMAGEVDDPGVIIRAVAAQGAPIAKFREHQIDLDLLVGQLIQP